MPSRASFKNALGHLKTSLGKFLFWHTNFTYRMESLDNWYNPLSISFSSQIEDLLFYQSGAQLF